MQRVDEPSTHHRGHPPPGKYGEASEGRGQDTLRGSPRGFGLVSASFPRMRESIMNYWTPAFAGVTMVFASILTISLLISLESRADPTKKMLVLDIADDAVDGPEFKEILDAYVNDMGVATALSPVDTVPATHEKWIELAIYRGTTEGAIASLWTEQVEGGGEKLNVFLVVLAQRTEATVVLPVELGIKRGPKLYRSLAAATRMILDTDLLDDLEAVAEVAEAEEPPPPWEPGTQNDPEKLRQIEEKKERGLGLAFLYTGDLGLRGKTYNQGITADIRLYLIPQLSILLGGGALFSPKESQSSISARQLRFPVLLGMGGHLNLERITLGLTLFWIVEVVRLIGLEWPADVIETDEAHSVLDTGGGAEVSLRIRLKKKVGLLLGVAGTGMVVSHQYNALGTNWFSSNPFRLWIRAGISFDGF